MNPLEHIMGANEASRLWGLAPSYIKDLCAKGTVKAIKIGKTWVIDKNQSNPKERDTMKFEDLNDFNSTIIEWEGTTLKTTQDPYIDDRYYADWRDEEHRFTAIAIDKNENEYRITWKVKDEFPFAEWESDDMSDACDWDNPISVEEV